MISMLLFCLHMINFIALNLTLFFPKRPFHTFSVEWFSSPNKTPLSLSTPFFTFFFLFKLQQQKHLFLFYFIHDACTRRSPLPLPNTWNLIQLFFFLLPASSSWQVWMKIDEFVDGCCKTSSRRLVAGNIKLMPATKSFVTQIPLAASSARRRSSNYARFSIFTERKLMLFCNPYIVLSWGFRLSVQEWMT